MPESCLNCHFYRDGNCHRFPPLAIPTPTPAQYREGYLWSVCAQWPDVYAADWCGEFKRRED